jgi:prevent-host-death family protein
MTILPPIIPISDIRKRQQEILEQVAHSPVVLTQHGKAAAVMVDPDTWNQIMEELEDLRDLLTIQRQDKAIATGEANWEDVDNDELQEWMDSGKVAA